MNKKMRRYTDKQSVLNQRIVDIFLKIDHLLTDSYDYWRPSFGQLTHLTPSLEEQNAYLIESERINRLIPFTPPTPSTFSAHQLVGLKGRKAQQIEAFAGNLKPKADTVIDYCCGKAHLGRLSAQQYEKNLIGIEIDASLLKSGQTLANKTQIEHLMVNANAFDFPLQLSDQHHVLALHACGSLHSTLIERCIEQKPKALSYSPCCYHKRFGHDYRPLSSVAKNSRLKITPNDLPFAVRGFSTASLTEQKQHNKLRQHRLAFDEMLRRHYDSQDYTPLPSLPLSWAKLSTETFLQQALAKRSIPEKVLSTDQVADIKRSAIQRLELEITHEKAIQPLQSLFELWLVIDQAIALNEAGYHVTLERFTQPHITPRNLLISAFLT